MAKFGIYYNNKKAVPKYQERWLVTIPGRGSPHLRTGKQDPSVSCPDKATGWQFYKPTAGWVFNNHIKIACLVETESSTTNFIETTNQPDQSTNYKHVAIGVSFGVGLLSILVICCVFCFYKRRRDNAERDDRVDENPVYMYDYADLDRNNEVYDTNAYYGAADVDTEGSTVATDLNPDYE